MRDWDWLRLHVLIYWVGCNIRIQSSSSLYIFHGAVIFKDSLRFLRFLGIFGIVSDLSHSVMQFIVTFLNLYFTTALGVHPVTFQASLRVSRYILNESWSYFCRWIVSPSSSISQNSKTDWSSFSDSISSLCHFLCDSFRLDKLQRHMFLMNFLCSDLDLAHSFFRLS